MKRILPKLCFDTPFVTMLPFGIFLKLFARNELNLARQPCWVGFEFLLYLYLTTVLIFQIYFNWYGMVGGVKLVSMDCPAEVQKWKVNEIVFFVIKMQLRNLRRRLNILMNSKLTFFRNRSSNRSSKFENTTHY